LLFIARSLTDLHVRFKIMPEFSTSLKGRVNKTMYSMFTFWSQENVISVAHI